MSIHYATLADSPRLQRTLALLRKCGGWGCTTHDIIAGAKVCAVNSAISELRRNGFVIKCKFYGVTDDGGRVYRYTLVDG